MRDREKERGERKEGEKEKESRKERERKEGKSSQLDFFLVIIITKSGRTTNF